jgi:hypothetical protein
VTDAVVVSPSSSRYSARNQPEASEARRVGQYVYYGRFEIAGVTKQNATIL